MDFNLNDKITLEAKVTGENGKRLEGVPVEFYEGETLIGSAISDSKGKAMIDYTVTDVSKVDFEAWACNVCSEGYSPAHDFSLVFDEESYIGEVGNDIIINATLLDDDELVPNAFVVLTGSDGSVRKVATNSNGVASFTLSDLQSGKYTFTASFNGLTETCTVTNALIHDAGITNNNKRDYWTSKDNLTVGDDGTLYSQVTSVESFITTTTTGNVSRVWNIPLTAEFDIIDINGTPQFQIYDGTNYNNWHMSIGHWVFNRDSDGNCTMTKDGVAVNPTATAQTITDVFRIGFQTRNNTNYNLKFRNFTVYSTGATGGGGNSNVL